MLENRVWKLKNKVKCFTWNIYIPACNKGMEVVADATKKSHVLNMA